MKRIIVSASLALALAVGLGSGTADAHATLVIGTLTVVPDPPTEAATLSAIIDLEDPGLVEVEDAVIFLELRPASDDVAENEQPQGEPEFSSDRLAEISPGRYQTEFPAPEPGAYTLSIRDRTYRQEEAVANVTLDFGEQPLGEVVFVLPPTATGPASLGTWLIWLIVVPLLAGVVVTVLVLRGGKDEGAEPAA